MTSKLSLFAAAAALAVTASGSVHAFERPVPAGARNILIVHDAFVDGSGWRTVHDILFLKGYTVTVVPTTSQSLHDDDEALDKQIMFADGPVVLVGHGYGGAVITTGGNSKKVKALVYVAGYAPEVSESVNQLANVNPPAVNNLRNTFDGVVYYDRANFPRDYAADVIINRSSYMADSMTHSTIAALGGQSRTVAWRGIPSYGIVATEDRVVSPELQRFMYDRAGAKVTELKASHALYISQPDAVAKVIEEAALSAK